MRDSFIALDEASGPHGRVAVPSQALCGLLSTRRSRVFAFLQVLFGSLITLLIVLAILTVLQFYSEEMTIMSTTTKREFNALITGLSIALGLSIARGLNEMVGILRWWILSRRYRSLRKIELILQAESVRHVILLACQTRSFRIYASALFWLLLTLV